MKSSIYWKIAFSILLLGWAIWNLVPWSDTPFEQYLANRATQNQSQLQGLVQRAEASVKEAAADETAMKAAEKAAADAHETLLPDPAKTEFIQRHRTFYLAFKSICEDEGVAKGEAGPVDLWKKFFPDLRAGDTSNIKKRNEQILTQLLMDSKGRIKYGLDLQGGLGFTLKISDAANKETNAYLRQQSLQKVIEVINKRINGIGVSETVTRPVGDDSVEILMPGLSSKDNPDAVDVIKKPAKLEFRLARPVPQGSPTPTPEQIGLGFVLMTMEREDAKTGDLIEQPIIVANKPISEGGITASGNIVRSARAQPDPATGEWKVLVEFSSDGAKLMGNLTAQMAGHPEELLAIVLDGKLNSAPTVKEPFNANCEVTGNFNQKEAVDLASVLNNPLDQELTLQNMVEVGPTLAQEARASSLWAGLVGTGLVVLFMVGIYSKAGFLSVLTLVLNVAMIIGVQASIGATLTLPGVAALVLTIGMAVDANILIYERMREEMSHGKGLFNALEAGHDRALASILDSHVTSIITAAILIWLGTGPIKGFGVILAIGLASNLFCVLVFNYALLELATGKEYIKTLNFRRLIPEVNLPFYSYRKISISISIIVILIGLVAIFFRGSSALGTDFRGGDEVSVAYTAEIPQSEIDTVAKSLKLSEAEATYQVELGRGVKTLKIQTEAGRGKELLKALSLKHPGSITPAEVESASVNLIGATVSQGLKWNALLAVVASLAMVMVYVAIRFEVGYAVGAIVATLHDVMITVGVYVLLGGQFSASMVAAVLMIIGYSLNDTVIVFDRVREELKLNPHLKLVQVLDLAVNKTFSRTTMTSLTVFLAAFSLFLFGAGVVHEFALVFMIGIATGTASSIFIANPVFCWWHKGDRFHVEARDFAPKYEWDSSTRGAAPAVKE